MLAAPRDAAALRHEVTAMRDRVRRALRWPTALFDIKHSPGGMMDVEFAVQYLVLATAPAIPACSTMSATSRSCSAPRRPGLLPGAAARGRRRLPPTCAASTSCA